MKIAIIQTPLIDQTGGERQSLELAVNLQDQGHNVTIFTPYFDRSKCYPELSKKVNIVALDNTIAGIEKGIAENRLLKFLYVFRHYKNFIVMKRLSLLIDDSFDLINPHNMPTHWAAFFAAKKIKRPIIWMCNEPPFWYFQKNNLLKKIFNFPIFPLFDSYVVNDISEIIVLDKLNAERVRKIYKKSVKKIYSGLDIDKFKKIKDKNNLKRKYGFEDKFIILSISTLSSYKRPLLAVKVFIHFAKKHKDTHFVLVGKGELEEEIKNIVKNAGLENSFTILKNLSEVRLAEIYQIADIFLFPAIQTWGLVAIEAMMNKIPVIVEERSGVAEVIENKVNGYKADFENANEISSLLSSLYKDKSKRILIGNNARRFVLGNFSWKKYANDMISIFLSVLKSKS